MNTGLHPGIPSDQYHADDLVAAPSLSNSIVQVLLREAPKKAWHGHPKLNPRFRAGSDSKYDIGTSAHAVLLENDASKIAVIDPKEYPSKTGSIPDGWTNKAIRDARDAARAVGKTPLLKHHYEDVRDMVDEALAFISESEIDDQWHAAQPEVTGLWSEGTGRALIWLRCRFDKLSPAQRWIGDYKTTDSSVAPEPFSRFIVRMDYHLQEAFYRRGARALGIEAPRFTFLAQECEPPYQCSLHACDPALQEIADAEVERAIRLWRTCLGSNNWPGYGGRIHYAMPTAYQMADHEMKLQEAA